MAVPRFLLSQETASGVLLVLLWLPVPLELEQISLLGAAEWFGISLRTSGRCWAWSLSNQLRSPLQCGDLGHQPLCQLLSHPPWLVCRHRRTKVKGRLSCWSQEIEMETAWHIALPPPVACSRPEIPASSCLPSSQPWSSFSVCFLHGHSWQLLCIARAAASVSRRRCQNPYLGQSLRTETEVKCIWPNNLFHHVGLSSCDLGLQQLIEMFYHHWH